LATRRSALAMGRRQMTVRFESTTTQKATEAAKQTASKASATASEYSAKASEGLSRVSSAAGPAIANAAKGVQGALGRIGGRTGRLIAFVERTPTRPPPCFCCSAWLLSLLSFVCLLLSVVVVLRLALRRDRQGGYRREGKATIGGRPLRRFS